MNLFSENVDFYPTPDDVINTMMLGEDILGKTVLEPSAGSGNIVRWLKRNGARNVIACERDKHLQMLLVKECNIIADDFLSVTPEQISHVNYIVMNPPFSDGIKHIKHAFSIAPAGCTIITLCNTSNIYNRYSTERKELYELVELYGCCENLGPVFSCSERKTDVEISLIKLYKGGEGEDEFKGYIFSKEEDELDNNGSEGLIQYNVVRDMVSRYTSAVKLFDETMEATIKINEVAKFSEERFDYLPIRFTAVDINGKCINITRQQYKKQLQKYYWRIIFNKLNMEKYATQKLREQINKFVEQQTNVPFTMHNIYQVLNMVMQTTGQRMNKAIEEAFDTICSFSADNSTAGEKWKTNANYMVNKKFIVPYMTSYNSHYPTDYIRLSYSCYEQQIEDVVKALCYITGTDYEKQMSLNSFIDDTRKNWGKWYKWGFFRIKAFKKGTMHFEFLDENIWMNFNKEVAKLRGWVLPKRK